MEDEGETHWYNNFHTDFKFSGRGMENYSHILGWISLLHFKLLLVVFNSLSHKIIKTTSLLLPFFL